MGLIRSSVLIGVGAAVGGALLIAHRVSQETGKNITDSFAEVPNEACKLFHEVGAKVEEAIAKGRDAYQQKQAEMEEHMRGTTQS